MYFIYSSSQVMNLKSDIIYGSFYHVLDDVENQMCCSWQYDIQACTI